MLVSYSSTSCLKQSKQGLVNFQLHLEQFMHRYTMCYLMRSCEQKPIFYHILSSMSINKGSSLVILLNLIICIHPCAVLNDVCIGAFSCISKEGYNSVFITSLKECAVNFLSVLLPDAQFHNQVKVCSFTSSSSMQ